MNEEEWKQYKTLVDAFDMGAMGALTLIMNQNENGKHYHVAAIVKSGNEFKQIKGQGATISIAINDLSKKWGEV